MTLSEGLLVLTGAFLVAHLVLDLRTLRQAVAHRKDVWLTAATIIILVGHILLDYI